MTILVTGGLGFIGSNLVSELRIGTKHILRLQEKLKFRMIFFSSAEVYGDYMGVMSEDVMINNPIKDTYQMNDYAISKWAGELMCGFFKGS